MIITVEPHESGERADKLISEKLEGITRSYIKKIIDEGGLLVNGKPSKGSVKLKTGDELSFDIPEPAEPDITPRIFR